MTMSTSIDSEPPPPPAPPRATTRSGAIDLDRSSRRRCRFAVLRGTPPTMPPNDASRRRRRCRRRRGRIITAVVPNLIPLAVVVVAVVLGACGGGVDAATANANGAAAGFAPASAVAGRPGRNARGRGFGGGGRGGDPSPRSLVDRVRSPALPPPPSASTADEGVPDAETAASSSSSSVYSEGRRDALRVGSHLLSCAAAAAAVSFWEDVDCSYLKPETTALRRSDRGLWGSATGGMGRGRADRLVGGGGESGEGAGGAVVTLPDVPSYNEIMAEHRLSNVPRWTAPPSEITASDVRRSVSALYAALRAVLDLKAAAADYDWERADVLLRSPALTSDLDRAFSSLRSSSSLLPPETRQLVGFHWGSCGWRHCGAWADAGEALAELRARGTGLYAPYEALFVSDVVERSLRDALEAIPAEWHDPGERGGTPEYVPYRSQAERMAELLGEDYDPELAAEAGDPTIDADFLETLRELRSGLGDDDDDDEEEDAAE